MLLFLLSVRVSRSDALQHNTTFGDCTSGTCAAGLPEGTPAQPLLCIVVPYRDGCGWNSLDRSFQLTNIIDYLTQWLIARGHSDFLFIVSEQAQTGLFNKGLMMNLGALAAFEAGCEHLCFHDVDQFPENPLNDYFYRGSPTHLCTWSSQFGSRGENMRPHVGGALLMSRDDYVAVNGFSNFYWRWGFEDNDMYHRIYTVFSNLTRLPQTVGSYQADEHQRAQEHVARNAVEFLRSQTYFAKMQSTVLDDVFRQLESDGLKQACEYADLLGVETDASRQVLTFTFDLLSPHAVPCDDAPANSAHADKEEHSRVDVSTRGMCRHWLLKESGLTPDIIFDKRLCTANKQFCVDVWTDIDIQHNTWRLDNIAPLSLHKFAANLLTSRIDVPVCELHKWREIFKVVTTLWPGQDFDPYLLGKVHLPAPGPLQIKSPRNLHVGHPFMMGWNESMAYLRMLIRQKIPFSTTRYGDGELEILHNRAHTTEKKGEWSWSPHSENAQKFRKLLIQPFQDAQSGDQIMMIGLPVTFCMEGISSWEMGGGGRTDLMQKYLQLPYNVGIQSVPSNRFLYSWQFGNLNYNSTIDLIQTLFDARWPILVVCNHQRILNTSAPAWVGGVFTIPTNNVQFMMSNFDNTTASLRDLARSFKGTAFLFAAGPISNIAIAIMHRANPHNIYLDIGGSLDYVLSAVRTREFHPMDGDESHFVRAGGALLHGQNCTETRWVLGDDSFIPLSKAARFNN